MPKSAEQYAIVAGSGFESFADDATRHDAQTPFGPPTGAVRELAFEDHVVYFLPRHGERMLVPPHAINYRANMRALADLGVSTVIALNTVGVIVRHGHPGQLAVPDQIIDYTWGRAHSIYGEGERLAHVDFTQPFSAGLRTGLIEAARRADVAVHAGGVYAVTQGPRLETAAEVNRLERDGVDFVGMTAMPEASLARELGLKYACLSLIVNYAAGRGEKAIHADIEECTMTARMQAMKVLRAFFGNTGK